MVSSLSRVSTCELECDGLAVHITNKTNRPTSDFSDNPGIAALWQDEKVRREWKGLTEDLVAPPSPVRDLPKQCFTAERRHKEALHQIVLDNFATNSTPEDPSLDSMMMSQSCDLSTHVMAGDASQQDQQRQSVTSDTVDPVVDMETVEQLTQLSQQLSTAAGHCSDQELLQLLRELAQTDGDNISTQNNIASQVIRSSQGISPSLISSHMSVTSSPLDVATPSKESKHDVLTPSEGGNCDTLTPSGGGNDVTLTQHANTVPQSQAPSFHSDSILFQDSPCSVGRDLEEGGADDIVHLTAEQRAQVISLCSHGNEEDLQLDNTYHCSLDECDITMIDDDVIECENDVMSQPWSSGHHLEQQHIENKCFSEGIPDIEDMWTSSFIDQIPQLDGAGDKDPPPRKCYGLRQRQLKKSYKDSIRPGSQSIWKPFKPPARLSRSRNSHKSSDCQDGSCDLQSESCDHQSGSRDHQDRLCDPSKVTGRRDSLKIEILTKSLFPYVKKLSSKEIYSIKNGLQRKKQDCSLEQMTKQQHFDNIDQTKAGDQICEDTSKKRPSLSLRKRKKKHGETSDAIVQSQQSPFKKKKFSPVKKLYLSALREGDQNDLENAVSSTFDVLSTSRYHQLQFVAATEKCHAIPHHHDNDNYDALHNMGYLSPVINDYDRYPVNSASVLLKCSSPTPSSSDSQLNTSFSLVLPGSGSSTPEHSSSICTDDSPSPSSSSSTSLEDVVIDTLVSDLVVRPAGSHDQEQNLILYDQVVDTPTGGSETDAISYISESPKSKLLDSATYLDTDDNACVIAPALAPPTLSHLVNTLEQYGLPHVIHEQPFCSDPQDVPPAKHIGCKTIKIPSRMVYELPEFQPVYASRCGSFASTGIKHWRTILSMLSSSGEGPAPPPAVSNCTSVEQYKVEGEWKAYCCPNKSCIITPAKLPPSPQKLLSDVDGASSPSCNQMHTSTPMAVKKKTEKQTVSLTPIKPPPAAKIERKTSTGGQSLDHSELSGPTLRNSYDFRISPEMGDQHIAGSDCHKVQYLTVMSVELHVNTRGALNPDPQFDAIMAICYHVNNDWSPSSSDTMATTATTHHYTGVIAVTPTAVSDDCNKLNNLESDFLSLSGLSTELDVSYTDSEEALLTKLVQLVRRYDADILIGYEVQMSSWGYLVERAAALSINLPGQLSRIPVTDNQKEYKPKNNSEPSPAAEFAKRYATELNVIGRIILNIWRLIQHEVALTSYTFENTFYHVLHQRAAKYSFQTLTKWYSKFEPLYCGRVIQYYLLRCIANYDLLEKFNLISRTSEFARLFGILFYSVLSRGSQFRVESMLLRLAKPKNFIAVSPSVRQRARMAAPESLPLILEPESRFYADPVVVLDFQSLYPSIIIAYNYCFSTCLGRVHYLEQNDSFPFGATNLYVPRKTMKELVDKDLVTISPNGVVFVKDHVRRGIMPRMLEEILNTRVMVKQSMKLHKGDKTLGYVLDARQLGLKLIANVIFGYTAASFSGRMPCVEISDSIISKARETLNRAIQLVNDTPRWGGRVVYGDTDSLFVLVKGATKEEAFRVGKEIVAAVTADNPKPVKLKFEKVYLPCVLQTKKRYVGYAYESVDQKEPIFDAKGIETVRRDGCPAVVKILERSIKLLFDTKDISKVKSYVTRQCSRVLNGRVSISEYTFAREYRGKSGYRPGASVPALELTREHLAVDPQSEPLAGERVPYVIIYGSPGLPLIRLVKKPMDLLVNPTLRLNGEYYVTKQILPALNRVFSLVGVDVTKWYYELPRVFRVTKPPSTVSKGTIGQYFATIHCVVCGQLTVNNVCSSCTADPQKVAVMINSSIRSSEMSYQQLLLLCSHCVASRDEQHITACVSLECPVLSRRLHAQHKLQTSAELREILDKLPSHNMS